MISLINDDCLNVIKTLEDVDISFTSPPYNRKRNDKYSDFVDVNKDWFAFNVEVIESLLKITRRHVIYNIQANYYNRSDVYKIIGHFSDNIVDIHIWEKKNPMPASGKSITNAVEYFLVFGDSSLKSNKTYTKNIISTSVNSKMPKNHKAVMKPEVAYHFLSNFTREGDTVLDPFCGVGTTGIVCKSLSLDFIGIELVGSYFDIAKDNLNGEKE